MGGCEMWLWGIRECDRRVNKAVVLERQKLQIIFLAQSFWGMLYTVWPVASLCWVSALHSRARWKQAKWIIARMQLHWFGTQYTVACLFYTLQTWLLNCKGANLSVCMSVSLCVLEVYMHRCKMSKTSFSNVPCITGSTVRFAGVFLCFSSLSHITLSCPVHVQWSLSSSPSAPTIIKVHGDCQGYAPPCPWRLQLDLGHSEGCL